MEEDQCNPFFWEPGFQEEAMMEFRQALFYATSELESTVATAKVEITRRDSELVQLEDHLSRVIGERNEALLRSRRLQLENLILRQRLDRKNMTQSQDSPTSQCPKSINQDGGNGEKVAITGREQQRARSPSPQRVVDLDELVTDRLLPEKGKLLQAIMDAGPILQKLMLAGPLPQWQHPPPQLDSAQIPPVDIPNKRVLESNSNEGTSESPRNKCIKRIS